jgi:hypothetical protein
MVAFMFLFAPAVVLIAVWIMQRFQRRRERVPRLEREFAIPRRRVAKSGRIEPSFSAVNDNDGYQPDPDMVMDRRSIPTR